MKNMGQMMKQVQQMQARVKEMQARIEATEIKGQSGAGLVTVTMTGKGAMTGLKIDPGAVDTDDLTLLEDLVMAAHADARAKLDRLVEDEQQKVMGGLPLPPGLGNMF